MEGATVKVHLILWCGLISLQLTQQVDLRVTKINATDNYNITELKGVPENDPALRTDLWRAVKGGNDSSLVLQTSLDGNVTGSVNSSVKGVNSPSRPIDTAEDIEVLDLDVDVVGSDEPPAVLPTNHRQKRTFWPFTNWFGYDYDYGYGMPPPMLGRPGLYRPGFGMGMGMGPMFRPPPPPILGLGFSLGF